MSTRGAYGFRLNGRDYINYNHCDSYPDWLGEKMLEFLSEFRLSHQQSKLNDMWIAGLREKVAKLRLIKKGDKPTPADIEALKPWTDLGVSEQSTSDWYCLMRGMQGDIAAHLDAGYMKDSSDFLLSSLFCEYAYIVNLDDETLEFYKGFNKSKSAPGRYGSLQEPGESTYFGVALKQTWPLTSLPEEITEHDETEEVETP